MSYDKYPCIHLKECEGGIQEGYEAVLEKLREIIDPAGRPFILTIDCYPGVYTEEIRRNLIRPLDPELTVFTDEEIFQSAEEITSLVSGRMTDDRVFGRMCLENYEDLTDPAELEKVRKKVRDSQGLTVIFGTGARLVTKPDLMIYADMARWELQCRFRAGRIPEWKCSFRTDDNLKKFKWGYFFSWRVADRHKKRHFREIDFFLDTNRENDPKLMGGDAVRKGLDQTVSGPYRVVPFFDPGVWGGQWMKRVCGLDESAPNYAWCFDCVPEEDSLLFEHNGILFELPSIDAVFYRPWELLGPKVFARFGAEFPIRFDFLDTVGGGNLSLQVHPTVDYIEDIFGMHYTQEESYYILDADPAENPHVYLGVKKGVNAAGLIPAFEDAEKTGKFDDKAFINRIPVRKHDHFLIPPGTIHCSGRGTMVLEISSTPYIFTFKLWDWGRTGLDGRPRPVHINHGKHVIRYERDTEFVREELCDVFQRRLAEPGHIREKTGLHPLEFIESEREWFDRGIVCETRESVNVLNLVEGDEIQVVSPEGKFDPFPVHYAETFIVPEQVGNYELRPVRAAGEKSETAPLPFGVVIARVRVC